MANPAPTINQINAFNATQGTIIDFNIIGGTELVRSNRIYIYDLSDNSLICTHLYVSTESIHELPANTDSSIVYESGKSSADFVNGAQYYAQIQTYTDTAGTEGGSGLSVAKMFWCLVDPTLTITTIPSTISTTSYNVSATYDANTSVVSNIIQQYQFSLYSATGSLLQSSGVIVGSGTQQGTSTAYDISYNFTGLSVGSSYYVVVDVTTTQGMSVSTQSNTFTVSIETPTLGEATVVNNACDGYISVTSNLSSEYGGSASGEIATFVTNSVNDVSSLKVTLTPQQDATPWIGTDHDTTPYLRRAMPTQSNSYNRESGVIVGGTVNWNQFYATDYSPWTQTLNGATSNVVDGVISVNGTSTAEGYGPALGRVNKVGIKGHKVLRLCDFDLPTGCILRDQYNDAADGYQGHKDTILSCANDFIMPQLRFNEAGVVVDISDGHISLIDLTAMFGTTIADYIYSLEQATAGAGVAWFKKYFPEDYIPYSQPTLQSVQATAHKTYDADGNVLGNYALDSSLTLRGIPKLDASNNLYYDGDTYASDGEVSVKWAEKTYTGTEAIFEIKTTENEHVFTLPAPNAYSVANTDTSVRVMCDKFVATTANNAINTETKAGTIALMSSDRLAVVVASNVASTVAEFKAWLSSNNITAIYPLATPTTETAQAYTNPQIVDPDGTEEYVTANSVPVGHDSTYSLVCPISGYDEVNVDVVGKNLFGGWEVLESCDFNYSDKTVVAYGTSNGRQLLIFDIKPNTAYTLSFPDGRWAIPSAYYPRLSWALLTDEPQIGSVCRVCTYSDGSTAQKFTTGANDKYLAVQIALGGMANTIAVAEYVQLELGTTATDYEPYQGQTYTATLPETVYSGTVDLVSGEVVIDRAMVDLGSLTGGWSPNGINGVYKAISGKKVGSNNIMSDKLVVVAQGTSSDRMPDMSVKTYADTNEIAVKMAGITSANARTMLSGVQLVYELATPQTIQLTPQEIRTLVGTNNVWSEDGDVEITYNIPITNLLVKRQDVADVSGTWLTLYSQPVTQASDMDFTFIDFLNQYGKTYKYALVPLLTQTQSGVEVEVEGGYTVSDEVQSIFDGVFIADSTGSQKCKANVGYGDVDMNQAVGTITPIGAKYPVVITNSKNQYHNGSIFGTIVPDDYYSNGNLSRIDMVNKRNELEQFLTNKRAKIIKDWNSNIWLVMIMDNINCTFNNEYGMGIVNFTANWIEVGDPTNQQDLQATGLIDVGGV